MASPAQMQSCVIVLAGQLVCKDSAARELTFTRGAGAMGRQQLLWEQGLTELNRLQIYVSLSILCYSIEEQWRIPHLGAWE